MMTYWTLYWFFTLVHMSCSQKMAFAIDQFEQRQCTKPVPIQIPECKNTFYNFTGMPNLAGQETQYEARHQVQTFKPLIAYKCSSKLAFFLCSVYTPMCDVTTRHLIGPCRPLCEHVKNRCAPVLRVFDVQWPSTLNCSLFPPKNVVGGTMCMEGPTDDEEKSDLDSHINAMAAKTGDPEVPVTVIQPKPLRDIRRNPGVEDSFVNTWIQQLNKLQLPDEISSEPDGAVSTKTSSISVLAKSLRHCSHLKKPTLYIFINRTGRCAPLCRANILFNPESKAITTIWTGLLTAICLLVTVVTVLGYLYDSETFRISERPIVYIAFCQLFYALGFAISLGFGRELVTCGRDAESGRQIRLQEGLDNSVCALVFILQYFFSIASSLWWILLTITWVLHQNRACGRICLRSSAKNNDLALMRAQNKDCEDVCLTCFPVNDPWTSELHYSCIYPKPDRTSPNLKPACMKATNDPQTSSNPGHHSRKTSNDMSTQPSHSSSDKVSYYIHNGKVVPADVNCNYHLYSNITGSRHSICLTREHIVVWLTTGLLTVGVLVSRQVDADELVPVCSVGRQHSRAMGTFIIGPQVCLTVSGALILIFGSLMTIYGQTKRKRSTNPSTEYYGTKEYHPHSDSTRLIRQSPVVETQRYKQCKGSLYRQKGPTSRQSSLDTTFYRMEGVRLRLGLFGALYLIPLLCVTTCDVYEYLSRDGWLRDPNHKDNQPSPILSFPPKLWKPNEVVGPSPEVFMLRIFMSLVPGITCSLWMCSAKGCLLWSKLWSSCHRMWRKSRTPISGRQNSEIVFPVISPQNMHPSETLLVKKENTQANGTTGFLVSPHPYAVYQYKSNRSDSHEKYAKDLNDVSESPFVDWPKANAKFDPCVIVTKVTNPTIETQHSNATTPGYYSQAKVGSHIEPSLSDTFSDESAVPPPLPSISRPSLPSRGEPCIGSSVGQVAACSLLTSNPHTSLWS